MLFLYQRASYRRIRTLCSNSFERSRITVRKKKSNLFFFISLGVFSSFFFLSFLTFFNSLIFLFFSIRLTDIIVGERRSIVKNIIMHAAEVFYRLEKMSACNDDNSNYRCSFFLSLSLLASSYTVVKKQVTFLFLFFKYQTLSFFSFPKYAC